MSGSDHAAAPLVPLATLIGRELRGGSDRVEEPAIKYGHAGLAKRGEDYFLVKPDCLRIPGDPSSAFSAFAVFDGHNGVSAAVFTKEHLLEHVLSAVPPGLAREEWLQALPQAMVAGFVKTDIEFQRKGEASGTTVTLVVVDGWTVTVGSVGDSRCILDSQGGVVSLLTVDHRLEENVEERERVAASGGEVGRLNLCGGQEVGPLRCWPGGLCLSRSIGDTDVGEFIVPIPHVKQVKLSSPGGRLIIASDGIWDALLSESAALACRGLPAELAAKMVVKEALRTTGLKDDTTCLVVDIVPSDYSILSPTPKKSHNRFKSMIFGKRSQNCISKPTKMTSLGSVEELFEEGSAVLAEREPKGTISHGIHLTTAAACTISAFSDADWQEIHYRFHYFLWLRTDFSPRTPSGSFRCAICQVDQPPNEGPSINGESYMSTTSSHVEGPFLCSSCQRKKDAMEGKGPSQQMLSL